MKLVKRILALAVCAVMLVSSCVFVNAATVSMNVTASSSVTAGVAYAKYSVYGSQSKHTETCTVLEFSPDEYIPMPFVGYAGNSSTLDGQYSRAVNAYGYNVAGVINGTFFSTANDLLVGHVATNGRLTCAHAGDPQELVCFDANGKITAVTSTLGITLNANGSVSAGGLGYVNKPQNKVWEGGRHLIFYYDSACGTKADTSGSNYEVLCEKLNNTEISVGHTLKGRVVSLASGTSGSSIGSNQFLLSVKTTSDYASFLKNLKAGDSIEISVSEQNASAKAAMENATGIINNVGWLVKNGVDLTLSQETVGTHSVTGVYARWTAFGTKPDGSYVFFTSEGGGTGVSSRSLTLRDVAAAMIKLGCNNVIRLDGGGSSGMYVSNTGSGSAGYVQYASRAVCDSILIVKKSSLVDANLVNALKTAVANAKAYVSISPDAQVSAAIAEAESLIASNKAIASEARRLIKKLNVSGKDKLKELLDETYKISHSTYTESQLSAIRSAYDSANAVYLNASASETAIVNAYNALKASLGDNSLNIISTGKSYTVSGTKHGSFPDNLARLTDGKKRSPNGGLVEDYSGWDAYATAEIVVDLGSSQRSDTYTVYGAYGFYGIQPMKSMSVSVSTDGKTYTSVGSTSTLDIIGSGELVGSEMTNLCSFTVKASAAKTARYIKFTVTPTNFVWLDEVEVGASGAGSLVVSTGKSYTSTGTKHGTFADNGVRLTDGSKNNKDGGAVELYSGWGNEVQPEITVDLGSIMQTDTYTVYGAYGFYGIDPMKSMSVSVSADGKSFTEIGSTSSRISAGSGVVLEDGTVTMMKFQIKTSSFNEARYIRFKLSPTDFVWIDEVEVSVSDMSKLPKVGNAIDLHGFNQYVYDSNCFIYTSSFGTLTAENINHRYTTNIILTKTSDPNVYTVKSVTTNNGTASSVTLASNEIMLAVHNGLTAESQISSTLAKGAKAGDRVVFYGVDFASNTVGVAAYAKVLAEEPITPPAVSGLGDVNKDGAIDQFDYILVKRHYFETRTLTADEKTRADVNKDGKVDQFDYILISRHYFGSYKIG